MAIETPLDEALKKLYIRTINENLGNLRFFYYDDRRIVYVLVNDNDIFNLGGFSYKNLYFVAKDRFPEEWQQDITAYHESFCRRLGHEYAKMKERTLAKAFGKEKEWLKIRKKLDEEARLRKRKLKSI